MKKRLDFIDLFRGICIMYMIVGHIYIAPKYLHYTHISVCLFFFLSGVFANRKKDTKFFSDIIMLTKRYIVPYLFWAFVIYGYAYYSTIGNLDLKQILLRIFTINNQGQVFAGGLWFLTAFYFCQVIVKILNKLIKNDYIYFLISLIIMIIGMNIRKIISFELWWSLSASFVGVGLYSLGYLFKKFDLLNVLEIKNILGAIITIILLILNYFMILNVPEINMRLNAYPSLIMFIINVIVFALAYCNICKLILKNKQIKIITNKIIEIGKNSMLYLCLNQITIYYINIFYSNINFVSSNFILYNVLIVLTVTVILYFITKILKKLKLNILIGK